MEFSFEINKELWYCKAPRTISGVWRYMNAFFFSFFITLRLRGSLTSFNQDNRANFFGEEDVQ